VDVEDNGPGIQSDNLEKVFDCFAKFEAPHRTNVVGIGHGLTLTPYLLLRLFGSLEASFENDKALTGSIVNR
jgi:K+-sensing histidine kinase KdpD